MTEKITPAAAARIAATSSDKGFIARITAVAKGGKK